MIGDFIPGLAMVAIGAFMFLDRRRLAVIARERIRFWQAKDIDVDEYAFVNGVVAWIVMIVGVVVLIWRPFA